MYFLGLVLIALVLIALGVINLWLAVGEWAEFIFVFGVPVALGLVHIYIGTASSY